MNAGTIQVALLLAGGTYATLWALRNVDGKDFWWAAWAIASGVVVGAFWIAGKL